MDRYDAVIVGSGFGGSVMAYRLAEAGLRTCLLERGKPYPPNSFPRTPYDLGKNFWDPSKGLYGIYNVWSFKGSGAVVASGLGGGSLIYANVILRKDENWFKEDLPGGGYKAWPIQYSDLVRHYEEVEKMLNIQKYPLHHSPYSFTPKTIAMRQAAGKISNEPGLKCEWMPLNLAVSFKSKSVGSPDEDNNNNPPLIGGPIEEPFENIHRMPRSTCRLCGECDLGCNYGSKNTLDFNYLSSAIRQKEPTQIFTLCEVKEIEPDENGYIVTFEKHHEEKTSGGKCDLTKVSCRFLILSGGTFGSTYLLLKNRNNLPQISKKLGSRYCVNGDLLSFISKAMEMKNGAMAPRRLDPSFGPVITSAIRFADNLDGFTDQGRGFYTQDGGHPYLLSWMTEISGFPGLLSRSLKFLKLMLKYRIGLSNDADLGAEISDLIGSADSSKSSFPVLSMGRDAANAKLYLKNNKYLECDWVIKNNKEYFKRVSRAGKAIAKALNAEYVDNPSYRWNFKQVITAHPLGGCGMGFNIGEGVISRCGEVFGYKGLYVADGASLPGSVGPNPSLTIAALANRFAEHIIAEFKGGSHGC